MDFWSIARYMDIIMAPMLHRFRVLSAKARYKFDYQICLLDVDIQGAEKINAKHSNWKFVFITPPSLQEIEARIRGRGMNTEE